MSGAIYEALESDEVLSSLGVEGVWPDYSLEQAPSDKQFLILRWGSQSTTPGINRGPEVLTVWAHQPRKLGTDYTVLRNILRRAEVIITNMSDQPGADGLAVTDATFQGDGGNLYDPGFDTITRNSTYRVLLHLVA